jgi:DNA-binding CsgD family transcriptional regulator
MAAMAFSPAGQEMLRLMAMGEPDWATMRQLGRTSL